MDYYSVLELPHGASLAEVKTAWVSPVSNFVWEENKAEEWISFFRYRKLAILHHPDKNGKTDNTRFQEIAEAYSILSDQHKKDLYDEVMSFHTSE